MAPHEPTAHDLECLSIQDLHRNALEHMDKQTRDYYNEGSDDNMTLNENFAAYSKYRLRPRVLRDVSNLDTSVRIFGGHTNSVPFGVAPTAMQGLAHVDGERATARACKAFNIAMGLSSFATTSLEDVAKESGDNLNVLQLYLFEDRDKSEAFIGRARDAGFKAVLLTVDTPMLGRRNKDMKNAFKLPKHLTISNFAGDGAKNDKKDDKDANSEQGGANTKRKVDDKPASVAGYHDGEKWVSPSGPITFHTHAANPKLNWENDIAWLKKVAAPMEVWVKGILTPEDALLAVKHGCDGIIVSNHGGRQLNNALPTLDALPAIVQAVNSRSNRQNKKVPIHIDGGIRHGTDIFKALALGADFCWIGRPILWGLAYKGEEGVKLCLRLLSDEIRLCMGLVGTTKVEDIGSEYLVEVDRSGFLSRL